MVYLVIQNENVSKLFMWLPDHEEVVRVCKMAQEAGCLTKTFRDWAGNVVTPQDGERFLEAAFDYFTLHGLTLYWLNLGRCGLNKVDILETELRESLGAPQEG